MNTKALICNHQAQGTDESFGVTQAFKELGGAQETLINYITAIYNQNNPIPSAMVALPPSGLPHVHPQQLPEGFVLQHHQAILPSTGTHAASLFFALSLHAFF